MPRQRREEGLFDVVFSILLAVPIWVGPILAVAAYLALRFAWPAAFTGYREDRAMLAGIGPAVAPWLGLAIFVLWLTAEIRKRQRRRLLDSQSGLESVRALSWQEFEHLVGEAYRRHGYLVEETGTSSGDGGVDLVLNGHGETVLVQCKQWRSQRVGVKPVRELYGVLASERADRAILATCGTFTDEALAFAAGKPLTLVSGTALHELVRSVQRTAGRSDYGASPAVPARPTAGVGRDRIGNTASSPQCPQCGSGMVLRTARKGPNAGSRFWGCTDYPRCRGTRDYD